MLQLRSLSNPDNYADRIFLPPNSQCRTFTIDAPWPPRGSGCYSETKATVVHESIDPSTHPKPPASSPDVPRRQ
jgi:hypothetical protein